MTEEAAISGLALLIGLTAAIIVLRSQRRHAHSCKEARRFSWADEHPEELSEWRVE